MRLIINVLLIAGGLLLGSVAVLLLLASTAIHPIFIPVAAVGLFGIWLWLTAFFLDLYL